jgi:hypothetical protein
LRGPRAVIDRQVVKLVPVDTREVGIAHEVAMTISTPDGAFAFERVPAGDYRLEAGGAFGPPRIVEINVPDGAAKPPDVYWGHTTITVIDENVTDLVIDMRTGLPVTGTVDAPAAVDWSRVGIAIVPALPGLSRATAPPVTDGRFQTVPLVPGDYFIRVTGLPPGLYVSAIKVEGEDAIDEPVALGERDDASIAITLTDRPTTLAGHVRDARLMSAAGAAVLVLPAGATQWSPNRSRHTRASMNGQFAVTGLPPGEYLIVAIDDAAAEGWEDQTLLGQLRTLATRVTLKPQESRILQLGLSSVKR